MTKADKVRVATTRYLFKIELYLSENVTESSYEVIRLFNELVSQEDLLISLMEDNQRDRDEYKTRGNIKKQLETELKNLKNVMQDEISIGDYSKDSGD